MMQGFLVDSCGRLTVIATSTGSFADGFSRKRMMSANFKM